jgi:hypothetical protein
MVREHHEVHSRESHHCCLSPSRATKLVEDDVAVHGDIAHAPFECRRRQADQCLWPRRVVYLLPFATGRMRRLVSASMAKNSTGCRKMNRLDDIDYKSGKILSQSMNGEQAAH